MHFSKKKNTIITPLENVIFLVFILLVHEDFNVMVNILFLDENPNMIFFNIQDVFICFSLIQDKDIKYISFQGFGHVRFKWSIRASR